MRLSKKSLFSQSFGSNFERDKRVMTPQVRKKRKSDELLEGNLFDFQLTFSPSHRMAQL